MPRITIVALILALFALGGVIYHSQIGGQRPSSDAPPHQDSEIPDAVGIVEGSLGYPSEEIPADLRVCAENVQIK